MRKVTIVILNWNNAKDSLACLHSTEQIDYPNYEILLVDNGSTDGSFEQIKEAFPHLATLANGANLGFAEGNNRGITHALEGGADFVLLLNNDTSVDPGLLHAFVEAADKHPEAAVFGAKIYIFDEPTLIWYAGGDVSRENGRCFHLGCLDNDLDKKWEEIQETGYACGCALMIRKEAVEAVGLMDPRFFLIWEEVDWCFRLRKAGFGCLFVPAARVWHKISASFEGGHHGPLWQYFYWRNRLLFLERHLSLKPFRKLLFKELLQLLRTSFLPTTPRDQRLLSRAALRGTLDYLLGRFGPGSAHLIKKS
jgi:GT2 family glycosyltransferase